VNDKCLQFTGVNARDELVGEECSLNACHMCVKDLRLEEQHEGNISTPEISKDCSQHLQLVG
jgi:hypothetical protein